MTPPEVQQRALLARRLTIAIATPIVLLIALGLVLGRQILRMAEDAQLVDHSDQILAVAHETLLDVINQETAMRGYLITNDRVFLEPFERARPRDGLARLEELTADNPEQTTRIAEVRRRYEEWFTSTASATAEDNSGGKTREAMRTRKIKMDDVREAMARVIGIEETLRRDRVAASAESTATTKFTFIGLLAGAAFLLAFFSRRQLSSIAETFGQALEAETASKAVVEAEAWVRAAQAKLVEALQGERSLKQLGEQCLAMLAQSSGANVGAFFTKEGGAWHRRATYALDSGAGGAEVFADGEGLVGRAAVENKLIDLRDVPPEFLKIRSGTGEIPPVELVLIPGTIDGTTNTVVELGFLRPVEPRALELLRRVSESIALAVRSSEYKARLRELLEESQRQAEELQTQQEELRVANEELEAQSSALKMSQTQLESQQAELEQTNTNLSEQSQMLERQNQQLAEKQAEVEAKAREVERASQFKSEFLSNMSHELRTPLNSSLILAKLLADNRDGNLTDEQVKFADTIYTAGNDLLTLINDILDLSKIESGKMEIHSAGVPLARVRDTLMRTFEPVALDKNLRFKVSLSPSLPPSIETDVMRLEQILKNLISNALKFTDRGEVTVTVAPDSGDRVSFAVKDTGIGIDESQQSIIFEAFRQADGTTNRKYGGTGLGLSISRELARLLGGEINVSSATGKGSTFTLVVPRKYTPLPEEPVNEPPPTVEIPRAELLKKEPPKTEPPRAPPTAQENNGDGPFTIDPEKRLVVIIEDDEPFSRILAEVAREGGFQVLVADTARRGFQLAKKYLPAGIVLDMKLPDHSGLSVLDRLKRDSVTRHIPVHVISSTDYVETALSMGAAAYLLKPVKREQLVDAFRDLETKSSAHLRRVLVVEDDSQLRESVAKLLGRNDVEISTAATVDEALALLRERTFDCVVTDLQLPDRSGYELLETMASGEPYSVPPIIVYTGRSLTAAEETRLRKYSKSIIVKGARSPERLLDEVTLFLHQVEAELPADQQRILKQTRHREAVFEGRTILVVEDDVRNVFALTSLLEPKGVRVAIARNGKEGLTMLEQEPQVDLVLMDIMMPEMDGLTAMREIRKNPRWTKLPIIALTAKAMRDDQEKCLNAGANDYLAKPLDVEVLLSLLRVWMPKS